MFTTKDPYVILRPAETSDFRMNLMVLVPLIPR
jgi:hypothetical protein